MENMAYDFLIINTAYISGICMTTFLWDRLSKVSKHDSVINISGLNSFQYCSSCSWWYMSTARTFLLYLVGYTVVLPEGNIINGKGIFDFCNVSGPNHSWIVLVKKKKKLWTNKIMISTSHMVLWPAYKPYLSCIKEQEK